MNTIMIAGLVIVLAVIAASAYMLMQPKVTIPGPTGNIQPSSQTDQQIDSIISQEMDNTLANVNEADVEQALLS